HVAGGGRAAELAAIGVRRVLVLEEAVQVGGVRGVDADFERLQPVAGPVALECEDVAVGRHKAIELGKGRWLTFAKIGPEDAALLDHGISALLDPKAKF